MISKAKLKAKIDKLPESFTMDELIDRLVFAEKIEAGLDDCNKGRTISEKELENKMKQWLNEKRTI